MKLRSALLALAVCWSVPATAEQASWKNYANARFAFQVCYPDWLKAGSPPANGDGLVFVDKSGGEMRVWGSYGTLVLINGKETMSDEAPPATVVRQAADYEARLLTRVTYRAVGHNWYALSGTKNGKIIYLKTVVPDDRWITLQLTYPISAAALWKPAVTRMASCLHALPPATFDRPSKRL
jgi:hypothetical protein